MKKNPKLAVRSGRAGGRVVLDEPLLSKKHLIHKKTRTLNTSDELLSLWGRESAQWGMDGKGRTDEWSARCGCVVSVAVQCKAAAAAAPAERSIRHVASGAADYYCSQPASKSKSEQKCKHQGWRSGVEWGAVRKLASANFEGGNETGCFGFFFSEEPRLRLFGTD